MPDEHLIKQAGEICEKITALLDTLDNCDDWAVLSAMIERTASVLGSLKAAPDEYSLIIRDMAARQMMRVCREILVHYRDLVAKRDAENN